jgi:hypothetical protein
LFLLEAAATEFLAEVPRNLLVPDCDLTLHTMRSVMNQAAVVAFRHMHGSDPIVVKDLESNSIIILL